MIVTGSFKPERLCPKKLRAMYWLVFFSPNCRSAGQPFCGLSECRGQKCPADPKNEILQRFEKETDFVVLRGFVGEQILTFECDCW